MTTQTAPAPACTAAERIDRALYELTLQRGLGVFDLGKLAAVLKGDECEGHAAPAPAEPTYVRSPYRPPFIGHGIPQ